MASASRCAPAPAILREIARYLRAVDTRSFRAKAYERGAASIDAVADLDRVVSEGRIEQLPGVGSGIARVVTEICETGSSELLERLRREVPRGVVELAAVRGISGPQARRLHAELGVESVEDLERACIEGRVRTLRGLGPKTEERLLGAIAAHTMRSGRVPFANAEGAALALEAWLRSQYGDDAASLSGGIRRWEEIVATIDLVVASDDHEEVARRIESFGQVARGEPDEGFTLGFRFAEGPRIRALCTPPDRYGYELLAQTGSAEHVLALAKRAREKGLVLDEIRAASEAEIYAWLDLPYLPPEVREGDGEVELAAQGDDFADLVTQADVRGAVHCHTLDSDGRLSIEQMARAALELGFAYITITDHSAAAYYAHGLDAERLRQQRGAIAAAQQAVGDQIRILAGTECDILSNGDLDVASELLSDLDVVIASIHARHGQAEDAMTTRLVRCLALPVRKIWGHPMGRLLLLRDPVPCRLDEVLDAAVLGRAVIEVNGDPRRLDLHPAGLRAARRRGLSFVISADAHSARGLQSTRYAVGIARRGWLRRGEVLNTLPADEFARAVRPSAAAPT
ncbi:MAG: PHP domain-containing protein [Polyangiaceae bacterium]|nr:PHP domain-containing protein [Polyangiaceae bacterium]